MTYEAKKNAGFEETWRVEGCNGPSEPHMLIAIFTGPDAGSRAIAYVAWQNPALSLAN